MRTVQVSDSTYAAIWANWRDGDDGEEGVIRRLLGVQTINAEISPKNKTGRSYIDSRYGVEFPEGFEIFRTFKGQERSAKVQNGLWMANNNRLATSLNQLSAHIGAPTENAWMGWYFRDSSGKKKLINELRDQSKVQRRN